MMHNDFEQLIHKETLSRQDIITILSTTDVAQNKLLHQYAYSIKKEQSGNNVYFRGLIEYSNICTKNCLYCGIRQENELTTRYTMTDDEVFAAVDLAWKNRYGSIVLQAGEESVHKFTSQITKLITEIKRRTNNEIGVTLSLGEQTEQVYREWFEAGAHRYLLRIESSNQELFEDIHPVDRYHIYDERVAALKTLKKIGYQLGTGVMIGLPYQTIENLADDLLFFKELDIDMCGMGPYIEHSQTPLYTKKEVLMSKDERFQLSLRMISVLRIMMKDINIASTTALQSIKSNGRELALLAGANIIMPNITPVKYRGNYQLYENKPCLDEDAERCANCLSLRLGAIGEQIAFDAWGDSLHFARKQNTKT